MLHIPKMVDVRTIPTLAKFRGSISCVLTKFEVETECIMEDRSLG